MLPGAPVPACRNIVLNLALDGDFRTLPVQYDLMQFMRRLHNRPRSLPWCLSINSKKGRCKVTESLCRTFFDNVRNSYTQYAETTLVYIGSRNYTDRGWDAAGPKQIGQEA